MATAETMISDGAEIRWHSRLADTVRAAAENPEARRSRRVILLVIGVCLVNAFDLAFTLLGRAHGHFVEMNPVAAALIDHTAGLVFFKVAMVTLGVLIMVRFRRRWFTELSCWGLCSVYSVLAGIWWSYYVALW